MRETKHKHRCMRCDQEFECETPGVCTAQYDVLPTIVTRDASGKIVMREHCPPSANPRSPVETDACTCTTICDGWFTRVSNHGCPLHGGQSLVSTPAPSGERVTPESLSRQVYERGEPITVEQLHALHDEDEERDIVAVTMLTKRGKPKTFRMYDDPAQAMNDATALVRDEGYSRAVIHLVENIGGSYETKATATLTPPKSTPATAAAPGAADANQVHGDHA